MSRKIKFDEIEDKAEYSSIKSPDGNVYLVRNKCIDEIKFIEPIICGLEGCIFIVEKAREEKKKEDIKDTKYILKIIQVKDEVNSISNLIKESKITQMAGENGISPKLLNYWDCNGYEIRGEYLYPVHLFFMLLDKLDITLTKYKEKFSELYEKNLDKIKSNILDLVNKLHKNIGVIHGDLHTDNIMLNIDTHGKVKEIKLIDYGSSRKISSVHSDKDTKIDLNKIIYGLN